MTIGTVYYLTIAPRSNWFPTFIKETGLDVDAVERQKAPNFEKDFPLKKTPAFLRSDGFKLTETVAIIQYLNSLIPNGKYMGVTEDEESQVLRWLCFLNQDFIQSAFGIWFIEKTHEGKENKRKELSNYFNYLDNELSTRKFIALNSYSTMADIFAFNIIGYFNHYIGGLEQFKNIARWQKDLVESNPIVAALPKTFKLAV